VARRVELILEGQLRPLGERRVELAGVGLGKQQAGRIAPPVPDDLAARRVGRVFTISHGAQGGAVEDRAI
jgi:hypothetical protein